jgi:hypothetical protein
MSAMSLERVSDWKAVLAAMLYLATSLAGIYGGYALVRGGSFVAAFGAAYPITLAACVLLFVCAAAFEILRTALRKTHDRAKRVDVHSLVHR